jgi:hypothetical protein
VRAFAAVLGREICERRLLALLSLVLGGAAVAVPLLPGVRPGGVALSDLQGGMALGLALLLTTILALFLGGSVVASDLAERRLAFYFSRPLPGWAIWGGKMAAALVLVFGSGLLALAPAVLLGRNLSVDGIWGVAGVVSVSGPGLFLAWAAGLVSLFLTAHAASVIVRARSAWALLDLTALGVATGLIWGMVRWLRRAGVFLYWPGTEPGILLWMEVGLFAAVLLALALAGALQVVQARTDLRRAHQVLSQTLWGTVLAAALLFAACGLWVLSAGPGDLLGVHGVSAAPEGRWIAFCGPAAHRHGYDPGFFYDLDSGRSVRARFKLVSLYTAYERPTILARFSADGRRAVWLENEDGTPSPFLSGALFRLDLDRPGAGPAQTPLSFRSPPRGFALSADGRRVAAYTWEERLTVASVDDGKLLAAIRYDSPSSAPLLAFAGPDRVRIYETLPIDLYTHTRSRRAVTSEILELDLAGGHPTLRRTGAFPPLSGGLREQSLSPDGGRILLRGGDDLSLFDARTGALLARLGDGRSRGTFLRDGRAVVTAPAAGGQELRIVSPEGTAAMPPIHFPGARALIVADQPASGLLRAVTSRPGAPASSWDLWEVDLERGRARPLGPRHLASLKPPELARGPVDLQGQDGVVWFEPRALRERVALRAPSAPAAAPLRR